MTQVGLIIGNSRLHWGYFQGASLSQCWDTPHLEENLGVLPPDLREHLQNLPIYGASVVPPQREIIARELEVIWLTLDCIPLKNLYPSLGIDRALGVYGAAKRYGFPCLVVDGGTALTFTGVDREGRLVGGAILPGLGLQRLSLNQATAQLPEIILPDCLPPRWARDTETAIASGILYTVVKGIEDFSRAWWEDFPESVVVFTGGDGERLYSWLAPRLGVRVKLDLEVVLVGLNSGALTFFRHNEASRWE